MSEKPIIFNGESIRAILDGRKTQTRRVIKPQPIIKRGAVTGPDKWTPKHIYNWPVPDWCMMAARYHCPYGRGAGFNDRLWVRETWATIPLYDSVKPSRLVPNGTDLFWRADNSQTRYNKTIPGRWRPSIFMPRWASRITLEVKGVRVERVQEISEEDCEKEGIFGADGAHLWDCQFIEQPYPSDDGGPHCSCGENYPREEFAKLWDSINAKRGYSWESNPWVWVVDFEQVVTNG